MVLPQAVAKHKGEVVGPLRGWLGMTMPEVLIHVLVAEAFYSAAKCF